MAKGEDALRRKKSKVIRKKMRKEAKVSTKVAAIIASKQRRKAGTRRMCEGMCFSLPTPEDPFNDKQNAKASDKKKAKKFEPSKADAKKRDLKKDKSWKYGQNEMRTDKDKDQKVPTESGGVNGRMQGKGGENHIEERRSLHNLPKFLKQCLFVIEKALVEDSISNMEDCRFHLFDKWGVEFLKCCQQGLPILETSGACISIEQIAWLVSTAANVMSYREKKGLPIAKPFLLILVPTQEKAVQVRSLCKPLKALGIRTVSLHSGASLDHQINGLKSCEPELLVSTPDRLLELVSLKAVNISRLNFLVVDGLETFAKCSLLDSLASIRKLICEDPIHEEPKTIVFLDNFGSLYTSAVQNIIGGPICRLSLSDSISSQSACITQSVHVCALKWRGVEAIRILDQQRMKRLGSSFCKVLFVEGTSRSARTLADSVTAKGYTIVDNVSSNTSDETSSKEPPMVTMTDLEHVGKLKDMNKFELVIFLRFPSSIDAYLEILTKMARDSYDAELHSFFGQEDATLAGPLIDVLKQCYQTIPKNLSKY